MTEPFPSTQWSLVLAARGEGSSAGPALASLCEAYRFPIYAYVRRRASSADEARDLVQEFFVELLEKRYVEVARPEAGRFRAFLLHKVKQFLLKARERGRAQKRGGGVRDLRLDTDGAELRYASALLDSHTPEPEYEKRWAVMMVDRALDRLDEEARARGKSRQFAILKPFLSEGTHNGSYRDAGAALGMSEPAVRSAVHRLRHRFGLLLREEVSETLADTADLDDELRHLLLVLS